LFIVYSFELRKLIVFKFGEGERLIGVFAGDEDIPYDLILFYVFNQEFEDNFALKVGFYFSYDLPLELLELRVDCGPAQHLKPSQIRINVVKVPFDVVFRVRKQRNAVAGVDQSAKNFISLLFQ